MYCRPNKKDCTCIVNIALLLLSNYWIFRKICNVMWIIGSVIWKFRLHGFKELCSTFSFMLKNCSTFNWILSRIFLKGQNLKCKCGLFQLDGSIEFKFFKKPLKNHFGLVNFTLLSISCIFGSNIIFIVLNCIKKVHI